MDQNAWLFGNLAELGLLDRSDWVHVALALDNPLRSTVRSPRPRPDGVVAIGEEGFECEPGVGLLGLSGRVELFGIRLDPTTPPGPRLWAFRSQDDNLIVYPRRRYAYPSGIRLYAVVDRGLDGIERASIGGGEHDRGQASDAAYSLARDVQRALLTLKDFDATRPGRQRMELSDPQKLELARLGLIIRRDEPGTRWADIADRLGMVVLDGHEDEKELGKVTRAAEKKLRRYVKRRTELGLGL